MISPSCGAALRERLERSKEFPEGSARISQLSHELGSKGIVGRRIADRNPTEKTGQFDMMPTARSAGSAASSAQTRRRAAISGASAGFLAFGRSGTQSEGEATSPCEAGG